MALPFTSRSSRCLTVEADAVKAGRARGQPTGRARRRQRDGIHGRGAAPDGCRPPGRPVAAVGALPGRPAVGNGPRGLQQERRRVELLNPRPGAVPGLPLGGGRHRGRQRRSAAPVPGAGAMEPRRPDPQGAVLRPDQRGGQPRRGRQGNLLPSRQHPHPLLHAHALQVPPGHLPLRGPGRHQPGAGRGAARRAGQRLVPEHLGLGAHAGRGAAGPGRRWPGQDLDQPPPARPVGAVGGPRRGVPVHRERDQRRAALRWPEPHPLRQGRHRLMRGARQHRCREPRPHRHQGGGPPPAAGPRGRLGHRPLAAAAARYRRAARR